MKFIALWTQTNNFRHWVNNHDTALLAALSPQYPTEETVQVCIYYETGDIYRGGLKKGKRNSSGFYYEQASQMTYNGEFMDDMRHGQGTLCSDRKGYHYIYDGFWFKGKREGVGQEVTANGKYNGDWVDDKKHGDGVSVDAQNNMFEGKFRNGKKHGQGKLTSYNLEGGSESQPSTVHGIWEDDELVAA